MAENIETLPHIGQLKLVTQNQSPADAIRLHTNKFKVFGNSLIVSLIISFTSSEADLKNFRLVNHFFQKEATKRWQQIQQYITLKTDAAIQELLCLAEARKSLNLTPFPFSSFKIKLHLHRNTLKSFGAAIGQFVNRYSLHVSDKLIWKPRSSKLIGGKTAILLSNSPFLSEFQISSPHDLFLSGKDLLSLPTSFPHLSVIGMQNFKENKEPPGSPYSLLEIMINRATHLKRLMIPGAMPKFNLRILNFLLENRPTNLPRFSFDDNLRVTPRRLTFIRKLMELKLEFTNIAISINQNDSPGNAARENKIQNMIQIVATWLETQTKTLTSLQLKIRTSSSKFQFVFPTLQALKNLSIDFLLEGSYAHTLNSRPVQPLVGNPFPSLRKLRLDHYRAKFGMFDSCSLASVEELHLCNQEIPVLNASWNAAFPKLTSLCIEVDFSLEALLLPTFAFILTNFTQLTHLNLLLLIPDTTSPSGNRSVTSEVCQDYWDIFTGGAPRSVQSAAGPGNQNFIKDVDEPVNGIYQVPSLRNMTALKTLTLPWQQRSNLEAILFMKRAGFLESLQQLTLTRRACHGVDMEKLRIQGLSKGKMPNDQYKIPTQLELEIDTKEFAQLQADVFIEKCLQSS